MADSKRAVGQVVERYWMPFEGFDNLCLKIKVNDQSGIFTSVVRSNVCQNCAVTPDRPDPLDQFRVGDWVEVTVAPKRFLWFRWLDISEPVIAK